MLNYSIRQPAAQSHALSIVIEDPSGTEVGRLGGTIPSNPIGTLSMLDFPRHCFDNSDNGIALCGLGSKSQPSPVPTGVGAIRYHAKVLLDGRLGVVLPFLVRPLKPGRVRLVTAHLEDAEGVRRTTFTTMDRGVYARISMVNLDLKIAHEHLLQVVWLGERGRLGRAFGGIVTVGKGMPLDGKKFPQTCDPHGHDGVAWHRHGTGQDMHDALVLVESPERRCAGRIHDAARIRVRDEESLSNRHG